MFDVFASFVYRNRRRVLLVALLGIAVAGVFGLGVAKRLSPYGDTDPSTQSVQATNRYQAASGRQIDPGVVALVTVGDVHSATAERRVREVEAELRSSRDVATVSSYYDSHDSAMVARDGRATYVVAYFRPKSDLRIQDDATRLESEFAGQRDVELGGGAIAGAQVNTQVGNDLARAELFAFPIIFLLSLLFFRSLVASLLPPLLGGLAILLTFFALRIVSSFTDLSVFAHSIVTGLGLGLAIDYSLFMVSRYREEAARTGFGVDALRRTVATSGRTIAFSSVTVAAALASLTIFPQNFLFSMGLAGAIVALVAATLALVVLPAMLALLGPRINALAPKWLQRAADRDAQPAETGFWYRLSRFVIARPGRIALLTAAGLIALGVPFASIKFLPANASELPGSASAYRVDAALRTEFPPGRTAPLEVVVGAPAGSRQVTALAARIRALPDVSAVAPCPARRAPALAHRRRAGDADLQRSQPAARARRPRSPNAVLPRRRGRYGRIRRPRTQPPHAPPPRARARHRLNPGRPLPDDRLARARSEGSPDERAQPQRRVRNPRPDLPARQPARPALLPEHRRPRRDPADPALRDRLRARHRLRRLPDLAHQGSARQRHARQPSCRDRNRAHRTDRDRGRAPVLRRDRRVRDLEADLHQGTRPRHRARSAHRRIRDPRPARALADGTARQVELVGTAPPRRLYERSSSPAPEPALGTTK